MPNVWHSPIKDIHVCVCVCVCVTNVTLRVWLASWNGTWLASRMIYCLKVRYTKMTDRPWQDNDHATNRLLEVSCCESNHPMPGRNIKMLCYQCRKCRRQADRKIVWSPQWDIPNWQDGTLILNRPPGHHAIALLTTHRPVLNHRCRETAL